MNITDLPLTLIYLAVISIVAVFITAVDKIKARRGKWRVSEKALFTVAALGGSVAMYITMQLIRHKTKHKRFMIGIPVIIVLQITAVIWLKSMI